jgi:hypothetical protein
MKKTILTLVLFIFCVTIYSQNRYSNLSTSTYTPSATPSPDYYRAVAEQRIENIKNNILHYDNLVQNALNSNTDNLFKENMYEINQYLNALKNTSSMSLDNAESYINTINRKYNKAVRKYNKRLKKANKN